MWFQSTTCFPAWREMRSPALLYMWHFIHQFFQTEGFSYKQNECVCVILLLLDALQEKHSRAHTIYQSPDGEEGIFVASSKMYSISAFSALSDSKHHLTETRTCSLFSHLQTSFFLKKKPKPPWVRFSRTLLVNSTSLCSHLSQWEMRPVLNLLKFLPYIYITLLQVYFK